MQIFHITVKHVQTSGILHSIRIQIGFSFSFLKVKRNEIPLLFHRMRESCFLARITNLHPQEVLFLLSSISYRAPWCSARLTTCQIPSWEPLFPQYSSEITGDFAVSYKRSWSRRISLANSHCPSWTFLRNLQIVPLPSTPPIGPVIRAKCNIPD